MFRRDSAREGGIGATGLLEVENLPGAFARTTERVDWLPTMEPDPDLGDPVVCDCMEIRLGTLKGCIERGCRTQEDLARETGATTVCGGCLPRVAELIGEENGYRARISEVREILPTVRSFRLAPIGRSEAVPTALAGQHVVVSALIDGSWVSRPYTLTSPAHQREFQEITVKLEPNGQLSSWLFKQRAGDVHPIRITPPRGDFYVDFDRSEPIVFFVAGIGITTAMAVVRTLVEESGKHLVHIDYSARHPDGFAFREELEYVAGSDQAISTHFRATGSGNRLSAHDIKEYRWRFPRGRFFICGPEGYQASVRRYLEEAGIDESRIQVEVFTASRRPAGKRPTATMHRWEGISRVVGLVLLYLYLAQGAFEWHWPWLEALQADESYRRWSGAVLLGFILLQWTLPILRIRERFQAAATAYRWHRRLGVLAPVFFYAHASHLGFGYLFALGAVYLANILVGLSDKSLIDDSRIRERYVRIWLVPHVALACITAGLTLIHVFLVFAYK